MNTTRCPGCGAAPGHLCADECPCWFETNDEYTERLEREAAEAQATQIDRAE